ncbi:MAG TPA: hypothetical protein VE736_05495 [Gaiellaceae bacterium]|nr:hypothetical protein [Gaiellaceae bacterium]
MRLTFALPVVTAFAATASSSPAAVDAGRLPVALAVSPARVALVAPASRVLEVRNAGAQRLVVDIAPRSVDKRTAANEWLSIRPRHLILGAGSNARLTLRAGLHPRARPGDHQLRMLLIARPLGRSRVAVRVRLGVGIRVRIPGRLRRRLDVRGLRVHRHARARVLLVSVVNQGNVTEQLRGPLTVTLVRRGRVVSRLRPPGFRELSPGARTVLALPYTGRVRGLVTAIVTVRLSGRLPRLARRYRIRL